MHFRPITNLYMQNARCRSCTTSKGVNVSSLSRNQFDDAQVISWDINQMFNPDFKEYTKIIYERIMHGNHPPLGEEGFKDKLLELNNKFNTEFKIEMFPMISSGNI